MRKKMKMCLPFALTHDLPDEAREQITEVFGSWLTLEARVRELEEADHELKQKLLKAAQQTKEATTL